MKRGVQHFPTTGAGDDVVSLPPTSDFRVICFQHVPINCCGRAACPKLFGSEAPDCPVRATLVLVPLPGKSEEAHGLLLRLKELHCAVEPHRSGWKVVQITKSADIFMKSACVVLKECMQLGLQLTHGFLGGEWTGALRRAG